MGGEECIYAMSTETSAATAAATEIRRAGAASVLQMLTPHDFAEFFGATTRGFAAVESRVWARKCSTDVKLKVTNAWCT